MAGLGDFEQLVLLAVLRLGPEAYGVSVIREIGERTGREVAVGAMYTTLERLTRKGLVESRVGDPTPARGGRRKKHYAVTAEGRRALGEAYRALAAMTHGLRKDLEAMR